MGLAVVFSGLTSMAAGSRFLPNTSSRSSACRRSGCSSLGFIGLLTLVNFIGIRECVWVNIVCTFVEVGGLLFVIWVSLPYFGSVDYLEVPASAGRSRPASSFRCRAHLLRLRRL